MGRRGKGEGHVKRITLRSGKTAWRGWLTVGRRANGTPIRRSVQRRTRDAVVEGLIALRAKYRAGLDLEAEMAMRVSTLFTKWLDHYIVQNNPKKRTPANYRWAFNRAAKTLGDPLAAKVTALELQQLIDALSAELSPGTLGLIRTVLDMLFAQSVMWRIRPDNPASDLRIPKASGERAERRVVSTEEAQRLLVALEAERLGLAAALTFVLGIRPGEAVALRAQDVDLAAGTVTISATHNSVDGKVEREEPKSRRGRRTLPLQPAIVPWVQRQLARANSERRSMEGQWTADDEGLLFVREDTGGRLHHGQVYRVTRRAAESVGLGKVGPRILRRSLLSQLAAAGVDPKVRGAIGGHSAVVTERHYREVHPDEVTAALTRTSSILDGFVPTDNESQG